MEIPHSPEAEQAVLGAAIVNKVSLNEIFSKIKPDDFYLTSHKIIAEALRELDAEGTDITPVTLLEKVRHRQIDLNQISRLMAVSAFQSDVPGAVKILKDYSVRRKLQHLARIINDEVINQEDLEAALRKIDNAFLDITREQSTDWMMNYDLMLKAVDLIDKRKANKDGITGISSGFIDLDEYTAGWQPGHLIGVAATPKMGKSSIALHFALHANVPTLFFTLEMMPDEFADRQIAQTAHVTGWQIKTGRVEQEWNKVFSAANKLGQKKIGWVNKSGISVTEIRAVCRKFQAEQGLGLVIIDQLDKIDEPRKSGENKTDVIGRITRGLKNLARDLQVPVIVLAQLLDKEVSKRSIPRPCHGDIRDSSALDQDADAILYLWRPEFYFQEPKWKNVAEIIIARQRSGKSGNVWVNWVPDYTAFALLAKQYWPKGDW